ncbi:hypothetical protein SAMN05444392_101424 [Seinonella peptonophila]|uniref:Uncharacterized protein n=1 Tax=Seinonella peptonophila TaxID=112248 RepID=A0A1M4TE95_9BACL|nr:hypothetical protein SAMN05444392_101424 [Seinonella peptonophila]
MVAPQMLHLGAEPPMMVRVRSIAGVVGRVRVFCAMLLKILLLIGKSVNSSALMVSL